jgi:hypothetical protein
LQRFHHTSSITHVVYIRGNTHDLTPALLQGFTIPSRRGHVTNVLSELKHRKKRLSRKWAEMRTQSSKMTCSTKFQRLIAMFSVASEACQKLIVSPPDDYNYQSLQPPTQLFHERSMLQMKSRLTRACRLVTVTPRARFCGSFGFLSPRPLFSIQQPRKLELCE